ncbi:multidrug efflux MFS transporter SdrM [Mammaliicoccus stepanovicii]|uniref:Multidrug transporter n=1 Tax=Mammaliicoccus stepanovicii TaxID=643214 RepID=A0A239YH29_9STAP|nr:multidrug efflux MFS transporter SdrM [Mammaliicoccus stepanovicii]PNZ75869.1 MFS transporter [Mammaliicoccus stepanovicii]GGI42791.1 MFS transporter [Mammaliicoccus stepanovicii]SNV57548.1 multidrug transporter [Mammaliicoccus stepanovicii]
MNKNKGIVLALVLIMFMSAIETSIVSLATPTMQKDLNIGTEVALIFTAYLIAVVFMTPIVGELVKRFNIKFVVLLGISTFIIGSVLCGLSEVAHSFSLLIGSRIIQGMGAGVMMTLGQVVPKLAFPIPQRYKVMGVVGSVWGISSIVGPLLGGAILESLNWSFLFYINVPIALAAIWLVIKYFNFEKATVEKTKLDYKGLFIFYAMVATFLLLVSGQIPFIYRLVCIILLIVIVTILYKVETKVKNPFVPIEAFNRKIILVLFTDLIYSTMLMGYTIFMPIYLQNEQGFSPLQSGLLIFPMSVGWLVITFVLGKLDNLKLKFIYMLAFLAMFAGSFAILTGVEWMFIIPFAVFVMGTSFGTVYTKDVVIVQEEAPDHQLGAMMSIYTLFKTIGSTTGSLVVTVIFAMNVPLLEYGIQNIMLYIIIIAIILSVVWSIVFKEIKN